jgi:spore germination protein KC
MIKNGLLQNKSVGWRLWKKIILLSFAVLLSVLSGGCTHDMSRREIDDIDMVLVLGIDYTDGEYSLTALYSGQGGGGSSQGSGGGGGSSQSSSSGPSSEQVANGKGKTAYAALQNLIQNNKKEITLAQTGTFLIGEAAAKQGLKECIDFLSKDETIKMESLVYIIQGMMASDFIQTGIDNSQTIHVDLEAIEQKQQEQLTRSDNTMVNILNDIRQSYSCVLIPYLIASDSGFLIEGYTVFDQFKMKDYLDRETSDGVNFFRNIMRSYPIYLNDQVSLYVSYTNTKLKAKIVDQGIKVTVKVSFETMIKEILTDTDIYTADELNRLTEAQNTYIQGILEKPVKYSLDNGLDILNLARLVENQNFTEWKNVEQNWAETVADIQYRYEVQSRISKSFLLGNE